MPAARLVGRPASPGLARGPVVVLARRRRRSRRPATRRPRRRPCARRSPPRSSRSSRLPRSTGEVGRRDPGLPDRDAGGRRARRRRLRRRSPTALPRTAPGAGASTRRSPATRPPRTNISAPAPPISRTSATACSTSSPAAGARPIPPGSVVFADDLTPSRFLATDWTGGAIVLANGSPTSHVAMLARARGVPMVVGVARMRRRSDGRRRGDRRRRAKGVILVGPDAADLDALPLARAEAAADRARASDAYRLKPAVTADGTPIARACQHRRCRPSSTRSTRRPATASAWCGRSSCSAAARCRTRSARSPSTGASPNGPAGKPVTIRTLDAGGDKPIPGLTEDERNEPVPRPARRPPHPGAPRCLPHAAARARPRRRPTGASRSWCRW